MVYVRDISLFLHITITGALISKRVNDFIVLLHLWIRCLMERTYDMVTAWFKSSGSLLDPFQTTLQNQAT